MEEKKKINPVIIILVVLLLSGVLGYIGYNEFIVKDNTTKENEKEENTTNEKVTYKDYQEEISYADETHTAYYRFTANDNYVSTVPVSDTSSLVINESHIEYLILNDGKVYCYFEDISVGKEPRYFSSSSPVNDPTQLIQLSELTGLSSKVKRIKTANFGTGFNMQQMLIMEDGSVYLFDDNGSDGVIIIEELSKYKIDDIVWWEYEMATSYKVILKDGTILEKTIDGTMKKQ